MFGRRIFITLFFYSLKISAAFTQVNVQDSLALVNLYNNTNGINWKNNSNWLVTSVNSWYGITIKSGRVDIIDLSNNNLQGNLPTGFCGLTSLRYLYLSDNALSGALPVCFTNLDSLNSIDLSNNNFTDSIPSDITKFPLLADLWIQGNHFNQLPDLSGVPEISNVYIQNNEFTFEDIEPNIGINNFVYSPQDSICSDTIINVTVFDTLSLNTITGGSFNKYQWTKNSVSLSDSLNHIVGADSNILTINKISLADSGVYSCVVTNTRAAFLTLYRRKIIVKVTDPRQEQILSFQQGPDSYCGDGPLLVKANNSSGLSLSYSIVSGAASLSGDTLTPLNADTVVINVSNPGDINFKPVSKDTTIVIHPFQGGSSIAIQNNSPVKEGDTLSLSVAFFPTVNYKWTLPDGNDSLSNTIQINNVNVNSEGTYNLLVSKNDCFIFNDSAIVKIIPSEKEIKIYELVTPNGDGKNDVFYIENIEKYPQNELMIFNAWNQVLYKKRGYMNDWNGDSFPSGTYYFILNIESINYTTKGRLYIKR